MEIKSVPIFSPSLRIPTEQPTNTPTKHLVPAFEDKFFLNITGNESNRYFLSNPTQRTNFHKFHLPSTIPLFQEAKKRHEISLT
jgi:hypothetical protein